MREQLALLPRLLTAHLQLSLFALLVGVSLSIPLGVLASRRPGWGQVALSAAAIVQTVPSLALLALMVPLLGALGATSIGFLPAFVALVLYTVLPVLRNTVTAFAGLPPALIEAARGVGMNGWQQLTLVELPLALPFIVAGVRTATVWTVGAATLATPVGADSLGNFIFAGLQTRNVGSVLLGCIAAASLALVLDGLGKLLLSGLETRRRKRTIAAVTAFALLYGYAGATLLPRLGASEIITVGAKTFTEQYVLAEILSRRISQTTAAATRVTPSLGSSVVFDALASNSVDVYVDYSGTIWANVMRRTDLPRDRGRMLDEIRNALAEKYSITLAATLGFENSYALAMRRAQAQQLGVRRISDLARHSSTLSIGGDYEFFDRPEWESIRKRYGLEFRQRRSMDPSLMYQAVAGGEVDVISAFSTDGRIEAYDLAVLPDDAGAIPPYDAIVLVGNQLRERHPEVLAGLRELDQKISASEMRRMNLAVDIGQQTPAAVADDFMRQFSAEARD